MALPPSVPLTHHFHHPSPLHSFTPGLKPCDSVTYISTHFPIAAHFSGSRFSVVFSVFVISDNNFVLPFFLPSQVSLPNFLVAQFSVAQFPLPFFPLPFLRCRYFTRYFCVALFSYPLIFRCRFFQLPNFPVAVSSVAVFSVALFSVAVFIFYHYIWCTLMPPGKCDRAT